MIQVLLQTAPSEGAEFAGMALLGIIITIVVLVISKGFEGGGSGTTPREREEQTFTPPLQDYDFTPHTPPPPSPRTRVSGSGKMKIGKVNKPRRNRITGELE